MDLSHKLPFPPVTSYTGIFSNTALNEFYADILCKNIKKKSSGLLKLEKIVPKLSELEVFACFNAARFSLFNNSPKVRRDALHLLIAVSETSISEHTIPYFLLLSHDENAQIKQEATLALAKTTKKNGGLRKNKGIVIAALGSMGIISFSDVKTKNPEEILSKSRMASCSVLAATQILSIMRDDLSPRDISDLIKYIRKATTDLAQELNDLDVTTNETLFFSQKLRSCLYRLYQETISIPQCPHLTLNDMLKETNPQCLKYLGPIVAKMCSESGWNDLMENSALLNTFYDDFLNHADYETINVSMRKGLTSENLMKSFNILTENGFKNINIEPFCSKEEIWEQLPEEFLAKVIHITKPIEARFVTKYKKYFTRLDDIEFCESCLLDEVTDALIAIAKQSDIATIVEKWPSVICRCIMKWNVSPKADWWCQYIEENITELAKENPEAIEMIIPQEKKDEYHQLIADLILEKLSEEEEVESEMWEITSLTEDLVSKIIEINPRITVEQTKKQEIYSNVYQRIRETKDESEAGEMIGMMSLQSETSLEEFPDSYDFLYHFFKVVAIDDVPESVELQFISDYFRISYPEFELHFFLKKFEESSLDSSISRFLLHLTDEKRQKLINLAIEENYVDVCIVLLITAENIEEFSVEEHNWIIPYLKIINLPIHSSTEFAKFLRGEEFDLSVIKANPNELLWYSALSKATVEDIKYLTASILPATTPLIFHLFMMAIDNADLTPEDSVNFLLSALPSLECITQLDCSTTDVITELFRRVAKLNSEEIISFVTSLSSYFATQHSKSILECIHETIHSFVDSVPRESWKALRDALSTGTVSGAIEFDAVLCKKFTDADLELFKVFPTAASKYYQSHSHKDKLRSTLANVCKEMVAESIESVTNAKIEDVYITIEDNVILCESTSSDDGFTLKIVLPKEYPLLPPIFDVSPLGKEKLTQDTRDEVKREFLRRDDFVSTISTWAARIVAIVDKVDVCPICLSLLDENRNLPKMKCSTCHKAMHAKCIERWLKNSLKKNCPCCRAKWKRLK